MRAIRYLLYIAVLSFSALAQPIQLSGTIGTQPVFLDLSRNGDTLSGWYFYLKVGKQLRLSGKLDQHGFFQLEEYTAGSNTRTGTFTGRVTDGHWSGTWRNTSAGKPRAVDLAELRGTLANVSGHFKCTAKRRDDEFGYAYTSRLDLSLLKGRVKRLALSRAVKSDDGDDQSCRIGLSDLRQQHADTGLLLRAKGDRGGGVQHCSIRILPAGDYFVIKTGDSSQSGDDCRGTGGTMFCTPRSFWTDLIVNRKSQSCRAVQ
jgi:hypothetical protein